ncbi:hypothetical protein AAFF_G00227590 [Aldrovandia affinis]|uniref:C-factor-like n=1 Tax=Aldrovandia affinis TaxID=143900 RepID=A0AAD7TBH6_9TELE|nr:hypothetical protein AAFF_G00227590 [Aldrovandia affinis]
MEVRLVKCFQDHPCARMAEVICSVWSVHEAGADGWFPLIYYASVERRLLPACPHRGAWTGSDGTWVNQREAGAGPPGKVMRNAAPDSTGGINAVRPARPVPYPQRCSTLGGSAAGLPPSLAPALGLLAETPQLPTQHSSGVTQRIPGVVVSWKTGLRQTVTMEARRCNSVLVTGSNRGIGLELVRQLAESANPPSQIFAGCRDPAGPRAKDLNDLAQKHSKRITIFPLDTADPVSIKEASRVVGSKLADGSLNLLINNAAINGPRTLQETGLKEMVEGYVTNVVGPMLIVKEFLPFLQRAAAQPGSGAGRSCSMPAIINVSTLLASMEKCHETFSLAPMYSYRTSKAALNMLTCCLAEDFKKDGILVTAIHPGWVQTDMGGPEAPVATVDSVSGMLRVISSLTAKHSGTLLDWEGNRIPW